MVYIVVIVLLVLIGIWLVAIYNSLVKHKNLVAEGWSGIDVQLKRRADLIPNLLETVKGYMKHEADLLKEVTELRNHSLENNDIAEQGKTEAALSQSLIKLFAVAENYPELKADHNFRELQSELSKIEEDVQMARRYYNGTVRNFNIMIESFPSNLVAGMFNFRQSDYFEIDNSEDRKVPDVKF